MVELTTGTFATLPSPGSAGLQERQTAVAIDALDDAQLLRYLAAAYETRSPNTKRSVLKETRRLVAWLHDRKGVSSRQLVGFDVEDAAAFMGYLARPCPLADAALRAAGLDHQPTTSLSLPSVQLAHRVLSKAFEIWRNLVHDGRPLIPVNPFKVVPKPSGKLAPSYEGKALDEQEVNFILQALEEMPRDTKAEDARYYRMRWLFNLLYRTWIRRDAVSKLRMSDFQRVYGDWRVSITRKGGGEELIIATEGLMNELALYRKSLGLPAQPGPNEEWPAFCSAGTKLRPVGNEAVYVAFGELVKVAERKAAAEGNELMLERLAELSPHRMRHTGITRALESGVDPRYVQAQATHSSLNITANYDHKNRRRMADQLGKHF